MSSQEALQQVQRDSNAWDSTSLKSWDVTSEVQRDSNECDSARVSDSYVMVPSEPSEVSSGSSGGEERAIPSAWQPDVAAVRDTQRLERLQLSEQHLLQLEKRKDEAEEEFKKQWWLTRDLLGSASMACDVEACLEAAQAAPREHPSGLLGQYAAWHHEVQQESARLRALREDNQLRRDEDGLAAELADVQASMQKNRAATMKTGNDVGYEQLSQQTSDLKHAVAQLTDTTQAVVQDVADEVKALKERIKSMPTKEEVDEQFHQMKLDKDATNERLSSVTGALDAAVKDELQRMKASLKELSSPQGAAALQQSPPKTIHAFEYFAHLKLGNPTRCGSVHQRSIIVTLVRRGDASSLASAVAPSCKFCEGNGKRRVDDPEALRQCVTDLLASHAGGPEQRWAYVFYFNGGIDNLSYIHPLDLRKRKPLPKSCGSLGEHSVEWFQAWLRISLEALDSAITDADVRAAL